MNESLNVHIFMLCLFISFGIKRKTNVCLVNVHVELSGDGKELISCASMRMH